MDFLENNSKKEPLHVQYRQSYFSTSLHLPLVELTPQRATAHEILKDALTLPPLYWVSLSFRRMRMLGSGYQPINQKFFLYLMYPQDLQTGLI